MNTYSLSHLTDGALLRDLAALVARDRNTTAALLAHLAEVDARRLYLPAACPSMFAYCVHELRLPEEVAFKRIRAARTARQFPAIFDAVAEGRLHLTAVVLLAPHLTPENAGELLAAAAHKTKPEIEQLLAQRFPQPDVPSRVQAIVPPPTQAIPGYQLDPDPVEGAQRAPGTIGAVPRPGLAPLSAERFALQLTMDRSDYDKLRYAQALLSHQIPAGDLAQVIGRALDALIRELEKRKFAATARPRSSTRGPIARRSTEGTRYIPAAVKRTVWERDGGQCTFVSEAGHRCPARTLLEFDHEDPVARGGQATADRMRLRCRAHNQFAAECTFGTEFMSRKRQAARQAAADARARAAAGARSRAACAAETAAAQDEERDVVPWLRRLGFRADEARRAAAFCDTLPHAALEERVRAGLSFLQPPSHRRAAHCIA